MDAEIVTLDGRMGEGGGQILRSALSLSMITGRPLRVEHVRGGRSKPGLMRQHLTCLGAAVELSSGRCQGATLRSDAFSFWPGPLMGGDFDFAVGSAGSVSLVLQTILPALLCARGPSSVRLTGGTHVPWSPSYHAIARSYLPVLANMGAKVDLQLLAWGFNPAGDGALRLCVTPGRLAPVSIMTRAPISRCDLNVAICGVPSSVGQRELSVLCRGLDLESDHGILHKVKSAGPGNAMWLCLEHGDYSTVFDAVGAKGRRAEQVARALLRRWRRWQRAGVPVDEYLADQLLLPLALAGGGSFRTTKLSRHALTNVDVIRRFLDVDIGLEELGSGDRAVVEVRVKASTG